MIRREYELLTGVNFKEVLRFDIVPECSEECVEQRTEYADQGEDKLKCLVDSAISWNYKSKDGFLGPGLYLDALVAV